METLGKLRALALRRPRTSALLAVGALAGALALGLRSRPAEAAGTAAAATIALPSLDLAAVCAAEAALVRPLLAADEQQFGETLAYWWSVNEALLGELDAAVGRLQGDAPRRGLVCVGATRADGEIVRRALQVAAGERLRRIDLGALLAKDPALRAALDVEDQSVLASADGVHVLARLPGLRDPARLDLQALVQIATSAGATYRGLSGSVLLFEGLDRVAPPTALALLRLLEQLARNELGARDAVLLCVAVGTPEAFAEWLDGRGAPLPALRRPAFTTDGDLEHVMRAHLALRVGRWPSADELAAFRGLVRRNDFLQATLGDAGLAALLIEHAGQLAGRPAPQLREWLHRRVLERAAGSHLRPADPEGPYGRALEALAARHAPGVDADGYFELDEDEAVTLDLDGTPCDLRAVDLLARSGLAWRDPAALATQRYRFDPLWLHGHLARRWLERAAPGAVATGCGP